tara:strand:- start:356 stop:1027 length:672 start_codon:yes stop_codon:yes gene_type:complete
MSFIIAGTAGASIITGLIGGGAARKRKRKEAANKRKLQAKLANLEKNRQEIINPYEDVTSLSSMLSNPMANLSVATQAAEMQIEQADISLANTLDTIRSTGASAGGATALAQAALRSKKGVAASIEMQEKNNEDKRAAGEQRLQQQQMSEAQRMQQADVSGKQFMFSTREGRELQQLNRVSAQIGNAQANEAQARADQTAAFTGMANSLVQVGGAAIASTGDQ